MAGQKLLLAIAKITNNLSTKDVIGYRLAHIDSNIAKVDIKDVPIASIKDALYRKAIKLENMALVGTELVGTQGSLDRLPLIMLNGSIVDLTTNRLTIIYEIGDVGYRVIAWNGADKKLRTDEIIELIKNSTYTGLSNAKIVDRDGLEFISAINGEFKRVEIKNVKTSKVKAADIIESTKEAKVLSSTVSLASSQAREEIDFNDTFRLLNENQRRSIETYYTWWTTAVFNSLTKDGNDRLKANPKKMQALATLRGKDIEWRYGGCVPAALLSENRQLNRQFDYCELGHKIYYVHKARGIDADGNIYVIKFGSQCSQDFFDISPEGLRKLIKVSDAMKEEIELICNNMRDNKVAEEWEGFPFMTQLVDKVLSNNNGNTTAAVNDLKILFGDRYPSFLVTFRVYDIPFPKSLLELCREYLAKEYSAESIAEDLYSYKANMGIIRFFQNLNKVVIKSKIIENALALYNDINFRATVTQGIWTTAHKYFYYIIESKLEGKFGYDPVNKIGKRGKGRFTQEASYAFERKLSTFRTLGLTEGDLKDVVAFMNTLGTYHKIGIYLKNKMEGATSVIKTRYGKNEDWINRKVNSKIIDKLEYEARWMEINTPEDLEYNFVLQSLVMSSAIATTSLTYSNIRSNNLPKVLRRRYDTKDIGVEPIKCHSINRLRDLTLANSDKIDKLMVDVVKSVLVDLETERKKEIEVENRRKEEEKKQRELEYRKSIVCSNDACKYNDGGMCEQIVNEGLSSDFTIGENDYVRKCNRFLDKDPRKKEYEERKSRGELDRIVKIRNLVSDAEFMSELNRSVYGMALDIINKQSNFVILNLIKNKDIKDDSSIDLATLYMMDDLMIKITSFIEQRNWKVNKLTGHVENLSTRKETGETSDIPVLPFIINRAKEPLDLLGIYKMLTSFSKLSSIVDELESIELREAISSGRAKVTSHVIEFEKEMITTIHKLIASLQNEGLYLDVTYNALYKYNDITDRLEDYYDIIEASLFEDIYVDDCITNLGKDISKFIEDGVPGIDKVQNEYNSSTYNKYDSIYNLSVEKKKKLLSECGKILLMNDLMLIDIRTGKIPYGNSLTSFIDTLALYNKIIKEEGLIYEDRDKTLNVKLIETLRVNNNLRVTLVDDGKSILKEPEMLSRKALCDMLLFLKKHNKFYLFNKASIIDTQLNNPDSSLIMNSGSEKIQSNSHIDMKDAGENRIEARVDLLTTYMDISNALTNSGRTYSFAGQSITIADDIISRSKYKTDADLTFKQLKVMKRAIEIILERLSFDDYVYDFNKKEFIKDAVKSEVVVEVVSNVNDSKDESLDDTVNWQKKLEDDPKIKAEVDTILKAIANGDSRLTTKIANIAFSVKKYGKISMKQYKFIKDGLEKLK